MAGCHAEGEDVERTQTSSFAVGARVDVHSRYSSDWSRGFQVVAVEPTGVRVRRESDGFVLPTLFSPHDLRVR